MRFSLGKASLERASIEELNTAGRRDALREVARRLDLLIRDMVVPEDWDKEEDEYYYMLCLWVEEEMGQGPREEVLAYLHTLPQSVWRAVLEAAAKLVGSDKHEVEEYWLPIIEWQWDTQDVEVARLYRRDFLKICSELPNVSLAALTIVTRIFSRELEVLVGCLKSGSEYIAVLEMLEDTDLARVFVACARWEFSQDNEAAERGRSGLLSWCEVTKRLTPPVMAKVLQGEALPRVYRVAIFKELARSRPGQPRV